jgi:hypothetical protein
MNAMSRIDLYISYSKVKICLYASRHMVGVDATNNSMLLEYLRLMNDTGSEQRQEPRQTASITISHSMSLL